MNKILIVFSIYIKVIKKILLIKMNQKNSEIFILKTANQ